VLVYIVVVDVSVIVAVIISNTAVAAVDVVIDGLTCDQR